LMEQELLSLAFKLETLRKSKAASLLNGFMLGLQTMEWKSNEKKVP